MICAVCRKEPLIGRISVPRYGDFPIGRRCYRLHMGTLEGTVLIRDFAEICTFRPDGMAANEWLRALLAEMGPVVSRRIQWEERLVN